MSTTPDNLVLEILGSIRANLAVVKADVHDIKLCMTSQERLLAGIYADRVVVQER